MSKKPVKPYNSAKSKKEVVLKGQKDVSQLETLNAQLELIKFKKKTTIPMVKMASVLSMNDKIRKKAFGT